MVLSQSSIVSPPQKCSNTVLRIIPTTGRYRLNASLTARVARLDTRGLLTTVKMKLAFLRSQLDLYENATAVSSKRTLGRTSIENFWSTNINGVRYPNEQP